MRPGRGADKTDARFATLIDEAGDPPCAAHDACAVCRLFTVQRPGETTAAWLRRITGGFLIRSECIHGHPFTPENTYASPRGSWICKACRERRDRALPAAQGHRMTPTGGTVTTDPACLGKTKIDDHPMIDLGRCSHRVNGSVHGYDVKACPACGATAHIGPRSFACGPRIKYEAPTEENCLGLKFKAERKAAAS